MRIPTKDQDGNENGWLVPLWNVRETDYRPDQVYLTVVYPHATKGPHLHKIRTGYFSCISGNVLITTRQDGIYETHRLGLYNAHQPLRVPPGVALEIRNLMDVPAMILNMPSPSWAADEPDDWPVPDWNP